MAPPHQCTPTFFVSVPQTGLGWASESPLSLAQPGTCGGVVFPVSDIALKQLLFKT